MTTRSTSREDETTTVAFDFDALEREGDNPEPFCVRIGGAEYTLQDPQELDYRDLMATFRAANSGDPELAIASLLDDEQREGFLDNTIPNWKLEKFFQAYLKHFGLNMPGKARNGSPSSSRATARR